MIHAEINSDLGRIDIETQWRDKERVKLIPGARWDNKNDTWHAPLTWATCKQLRGVFADQLEIGSELYAWAMHEYETRVAPLLDLRQQRDVENWSGDDRLFPFQKVGVEFLTIAGQALLADEMGTGKTVQTICTLETLGDSAYPVLVVCPNSMKRTWEREFSVWGPDRKVQVISGGAATRRKQFAEDADVYVINWEALRIHSRLKSYGSIALSDKEKEVGELNRPWGTVVADEAHKAKNPKAKQTRALWAIGETSTYRYALTGTPIANTPDDLWALMHFIHQDEWPARTRYIDRYCLTSFNPFGGVDIIGVKPETKEEFFQILDPRFIRRPKKAVLPDLPPKVRTVRYVEMSAKQKRAYKQMRDEYVALLDDGAATIATNPLVHLTRLTQFACAFAEIDEEGKVKLADPSCKIDALAEIVEEMGNEQIVAFAESRQLIELAENRLEKMKVPFVSIRGGVSEDDRQKNIDRFQDGKAQVCLVTLGAGGEGITLTAAHVNVFLQRSWSMVKNKQGEDRTHRMGQTAEKVLYIDVVAEGTVEEYRALRLEEKEGRLEEIVRDGDTIKKMLQFG